MNDKIKSFIQISEDLNSNLVDNIFELNVKNANLIESKTINKNDLSDMTLNISNLDISKLIDLFKLNTKALEDFFKFQIFQILPIEEIKTIILQFTESFNFEMFEKVFNFSLENSHLVSLFNLSKI